jgi:4-amino-4-deoxy-L-arabinose transferase-like glycosyltransferase
MPLSLFQRPGPRLLAVLVVCFFAFFVHLGTTELSLMEARNFIAAREMAAGGSWLIPTLNGELRLAKPPLPTWAVAAVLRLAGPTESLALLRLPGALMATLLVLFFWGLCRELTRDLPNDLTTPGRTAWLAALVLASSLLVVTVGREGQWDIFSNSLMLGSLWLLVRGWRQPGGAGSGWLAGAGALAGLTFLSKGPVAPYAVLLPFVGAYVSRLHPGGGAAMRRHWRGGLLALGLAVAIGAAWPAYVLLHVAPAARAVATTEIASWAERHVQPFWYYFNFMVFAGVWAWVALCALAVPYARPRAGRFVPYALALGWLLASLLLLSLVPEKKERYMLPLLPPLALLAAGLLRAWEVRFAAGVADRPDRVLLRVWAGLLLALALLLPVALALPTLPGFGAGTGRFGAVALGGLAVAGAAYWGGLRGPMHPTRLAGASLGLMGLILALLLPLYQPWQQRRDEPGLRRISTLRQNATLAALPWYHLNDLNMKQVWLAGRAAPTLHPEADARPLGQLPLVVLSTEPVLPQLPAAWQARLRAEVVDSFYTDRTHREGRWLVTVLR